MKHKAKDTLTAVEMNRGEIEEFELISGGIDHSHFVFKIQDYGRAIPLDSWILFWQMYKDQKASQP